MKHKKLIIYCAISLGIVLILSIIIGAMRMKQKTSPSTTDTIAPYDWREYKDSKYNYAINYPKDWDIHKDRDALLLENKERRSLRIMVYPGKTLNTSGDITKEINGGCPRSESVTFGLNLSGQKLYCNANDPKHELIMYLTEKGGNVYSIRYTDIFDDSYKLLERMIETFRTTV